MQSFETAQTLRAELKKVRMAGKTIGLVPTMGNLHQGHLALVEQAKKHCDYVLATIFVNPMQFGIGEDFERYPKTLEQDMHKLSSASCDGLFMPSVAEMYPNGLEQQTLVSVPKLSLRHCGKSRPGHFDGVCTVVNKLFNLTSPDKAYFGTKDFQQLLVIKKMAVDLCMPIDINAVPIQRDTNGLALSSRNAYLSENEKLTAATLFATLNKAKQAITTAAKPNFADIEALAKEDLSAAGMILDYFNICKAQTLEPALPSDAQIVILAAVFLGKTRLIDNVDFHRQID